MKILLTGSHGFIGTHFRKKSGFKDIVCWDLKEKKNIKDITAKDLADIDVVVHLAAKISARESLNKPYEYFENNLLYSIKLISEAIKAGVPRFVFASSAAAEGNSPYGLSKKIFEDLIEEYFGDKIRCHILRFYNVYGKDQSPEYAGVITKFLENIRKDKPLTIFGDGDQTRDFIYVDDVVDCITCAIHGDYERSKVTYVGTGVETTISDLADLVKKLTGSKVKIKHGLAREEIRNSCAPGELEDVISLEEGLKKMIK